MLRTLWILSRPKGLPLITILPIVGFTFAIWDHGCMIPEWGALPYLGLLAGVWVVPHAGTMWLNAALDRDEGEVMFGKSVPVPPGIERWGYATLVLAVAVAFWVHRGLGVCVVGCAALSVLYSHPRTAWKGHAILGPLANAVGYGILSPVGGFLLADLPPTPRGVAVLAAGVGYILTAYLSAQAFQEEEDRARGYRTLVALRGPRFTLRVTRAFLWASVGATLGLAAIGWLPRAVLVSAPAFAIADRWLVRWTDRANDRSSAWAAGFFVRMTIAGLVCLAAACAHYAWQADHGGPMGGLGTASGQPAAPTCGRFFRAVAHDLH